MIKCTQSNTTIFNPKERHTPQKLMQCLKMGAVDFINKPYTKEQVAHTVEMFKKIRAKRIDKVHAEQYNDF